MTTTTEITATITSARQRKWTDGRGRRGSDRPDGRSIAHFDFSALDADVWEQIINRRNRPHNAARPLVERALRDAGIEFTGLRWSQRAGCSCGCSPGFLMDGAALGWDYTVAALG